MENNKKWIYTNYFNEVKWFIKFAGILPRFHTRACMNEDLWRNFQTLPSFSSQHSLLIYLAWHTTVRAWLFAQSILRFLFRQYFIRSALNRCVVAEAIKATWMPFLFSFPVFRTSKKSRKSQENELAFNQSSDFSAILKLNYL